MDSLQYVVEMDVLERPHFLIAARNAWTFEGGASFDAQFPRLRGVPFLTRPIEAPDTLEAGAPCGE